jgi:hypothetical protein
MLKGEIDRNNKDEIKVVGTPVDNVIYKLASQVIPNKRGNDGNTLTIHESSAALGMIFCQIVEVVQSLAGLDKQHKSDIK